MCFENKDFRDLLTNAEFTGDLAMVAVDEAHCISQWGGEFRPAYGRLSQLRSFVPTHIPFLATSATLPPAALQDVRAGLLLNPKSTYVVNLGNDRHNITMSVKTIKSRQDFDAVLPLLTRNGCPPALATDLLKTCIFVNSVPLSRELGRFIQNYVPAAFRSAIDMMFSLRTARAKRRVMKEFKQGDVRVLVATEAAGMGADIPDIEQVLQFAVPSSLSRWRQLL
ncbi:hypothetical protein H1R20_g735, partial [Candolleomyces eurysporus]